MGHLLDHLDNGPEEAGVNELAADSNGEGLRVCIVVAQWNAFVTHKLLDGAKVGAGGAGRAGGRHHGGVGAWFLRGSGGDTRWAAESGNFDAVIAIGTVIKGRDRPLRAHRVAGGGGNHGDVAGDGRARRIRRADLRHRGAGARRGREAKQGNKGDEAAEAAIQMARLRERLA